MLAYRPASSASQYHEFRPLPYSSCSDTTSPRELTMSEVEALTWITDGVFIVNERTDHHLLLAKQRASILWLVAKANNNKIPEDLLDPYYKDHEEQDQLKPTIVRSLANAEYYCLALGHIYADPNYHTLNHWGVIQALARKGVYVAEPSDVALTETVLIQTSPIKMSAHMAVIEAVMALYLKETVTIERIMNTMRKLLPNITTQDVPSDIEEGLLFWVNKVCLKMRTQIEDELNIGPQKVNKNEEKIAAPTIPLLQDLSDLSDGCCLSILMSYYCPSALPWQDVCINDPMSMADSLYNIQLIQRFCADHLPFNPSYLTLEDMVYQHSSVRQNNLVFLADLFYMFEVRPAKCVEIRGNRNEIFLHDGSLFIAQRNGHALVSGKTKRTFQNPVSPIPDLRTNTYNSFSSIPYEPNRTSQNMSATTPREALLPRRQDGAHSGGRTFDRSKRHSVHESNSKAASPPHSKISVINSGSHSANQALPGSSNGAMRRTHSMADIDRGNGGGGGPHGVEKTSPPRETTSRNSYHDFDRTEYPVHRMLKSKHLSSENIHSLFDDDANDVYLRPNTNKVGVGIPPNSVVSQPDEPLMPARLRPSKEKYNCDSKNEELGESVPPAGIPSGMASSGQRPRLVYTNSVKRSGGREVEHGGGSRHGSPQRGFHLHHENTDNRFDEPMDEGKKRIQSPLHKPQTLSLSSNPVRDGPESLGSSESGVVLEKDHRISQKNGATTPTTSFAQLSKLGSINAGAGINIVYMQNEHESREPGKSSFLTRKDRDDHRGNKKASFAALPNTTTWSQQHARSGASSQGDSGHESPPDGAGGALPSGEPTTPLASQLCNVKLKLEEKRQRIEAEKRKMEREINKMRQKVGEEAFLQAVTKTGAPRGMVRQDNEGEEYTPKRHPKERTERGEAYREICRSVENLDISLSDINNDLAKIDMMEQRSRRPESRQGSRPPSRAGSQTAWSVDTDTFYLHDRPASQPVPTMSGLQQRAVSQEQLFQPFLNPAHHTLSREQLYSASAQPSLQRSMSREQLYHPPPLSRSASRDHLFDEFAMFGLPPAPLRRALSRDQLYFGALPPPLPRSLSREQLYPVHQNAVPWGGDAEFGGGVPLEQPGYILHPTAAPQYPGYCANGPTELPYGVHEHAPYGGDMYGGYPSGMGPPPFRLHVDAMGQPLMSSRSQSPMTAPQYYQQQLPQQVVAPRPPPAHHYVPHLSGLPARAQPVETPSDLDMEPQSVHFIEAPGHMIVERPPPARISSLSGTATYRIGSSPTRAPLSLAFFDDQDVLELEDEIIHSQMNRDVSEVDKGFFIAFDDGEPAPRKPKPQLRIKKVPKVIPNSSDKYREEMIPPPVLSGTATLTMPSKSRGNESRTNSREKQGFSQRQSQERTEGEKESRGSESPTKTSLGLVIGSELLHPDPTSEDEMAKKRERILMNALRRKEQLEEARARKESEAAKKREEERLKQELMERKKEEEKARRQAILEQYKQRKAAMEEEGDKPDGSRTSTLSKKSSRGSLKPRPKSLHESCDSRSSVLSSASGSTRGSQINLNSSNDSNNTFSSHHYNALSDYVSSSAPGTMGRCTPPRRTVSPAYRHHPPSPSMGPPGPASLPPGLVSRRMGGVFSDTASDTGSACAMEYTGPKLFKQPTAKSNRGIITNAISTVLAGAVNSDTKRRVLEEINRSDSKHFLILFRDAGCQFRALYSYAPERDDVLKLFGTGPRQITDPMMDKFYKFNCGGRSFTEIHTKHLTPTIDAITIQNSLWQTKRPPVQQTKRDYF